MKVFTTRNELTDYLRIQKNLGYAIGFTPTMGALHDGHLALIKASGLANEISICSIFVNPTQFNDKADFEKYPQSLDTDIQLLASAGCDAVFAPSVNEMYNEVINENENYELGYLETILEGQYRPGHFQGVCKIMYRLLKLVNADNLYMGQKDYQQCMVIKKLIELALFKVQLQICKTVREPSGLAMSSRNMRLSASAKEKSLAIYKIFQFIKQEINTKPINTLIETAKENLTQAGFEKIDYVAIANAENLLPITNWDGKTPLVALVAAFIDDVRLIDNMVLTAD